MNEFRMEKYSGDSLIIEVYNQKRELIKREYYIRDLSSRDEKYIKCGEATIKNRK